MNIRIFKLITAVVAVFFATATIAAQEAKTMYVMQDNVILFEYDVSKIDSIIFYKPSISIPEGGVLINGVIWASCNVDAPGAFAATPESPGMFYQWNRKTAWSATGTITGWDSTTPSGTTWEKSNDPSPSGWRVPTTEEQRSLLDTDRVTREWIEDKKGMKFTDNTTGASIFLPAVGLRSLYDGSLYDAGLYGSYWSSTAGELYADAYFLSFDYSGGADWSWSVRSNGRSVRSVAEK